MHKRSGPREGQDSGRRGAGRGAGVEEAWPRATGSVGFCVARGLSSRGPHCIWRVGYKRETARGPRLSLGVAEARLVRQVIQIPPRAKAGWDPSVCTGRLRAVLQACCQSPLSSLFFLSAYSSPFIFSSPRPSWVLPGPPVSSLRARPRTWSVGYTTLMPHTLTRCEDPDNTTPPPVEGGTCAPCVAWMGEGVCPTPLEGLPLTPAEKRVI